MHMLNDSKNQNKVTTGSVIKYMILPRILPRIALFIRSGFKMLAFFMACIFSTARLLPTTHPYLRPANIGSFGVIHVIAAAANNLSFKKENADQIIIFSAIMLGILLLVLQFLSLILGFALPAASAQIATFLNPYSTGSPAVHFNGRLDIAMILLDRVFGVPGLFNSCVSDIGVACTALNVDGTNSATATTHAPSTFPWPFHNGLHQMYLFYNSALLIVGLLILCYFIFVILIETTQTGTPFGRRFNKVWAPIRIVVAFGLLIPFSHGMNSAQFITLYAAKWGSGLATTAWWGFTSGLTELTSSAELVGTPKAQNSTNIIGFMALAHACKHAEELHYPYANLPPAAPNKSVEAWLVKREALMANASTGMLATAYPDALDFYDDGNILIRFGDRDPHVGNEATIPAAYPAFRGLVYPTCGDLVIPTTDLNGVGSTYIRKEYYSLITLLWAGAGGTNLEHCESAPLIALRDVLETSSQAWMSSRIKQAGAAAAAATDANYFTASETKETALKTVQAALQCIINRGVVEEKATGSLAMPSDLKMRGWAGAGIWYNKIAAANGAVISAAGNLPAPASYTRTMQDVAKLKLRTDPNVKVTDLYNPAKKAGPTIALPRAGEDSLAAAYFGLYNYWLSDADRIGNTSSTGNIFGQMIISLFGLDGLYSITDNNAVHPLAKLVGVGKSLIDATIRNLSIGTGAMGFGALAGMVNHDVAQFGAKGADMVVEVMFSIATVGLTAGFVLYYVIPFLPFIYFFFAVGNWIKTVFEAMVGAPLWALAHIRIDGNGLPGDAAVNGYFLIFEIFLRPLMIIFGLIAGISVFAAMAAVLHDIWDIVLANLAGTGTTEETTMIESIRGPVDKLFYLVVYTIILYMVAISSFKLVELIPQQILRWMGANVPTFVDQSQDAAGGLVQYAAIGGGHMFSQFTGGVQGAYKGLRGGQSSAIQNMSK